MSGVADRTSGDAIEVWNTATRQREFGLPPAPNVLSRWFGFLKAPGRFVRVRHLLRQRRHRVSHLRRRPTRSGVGCRPGKAGIEDVSGDGTVAAYSVQDAFAGVLHLDPAVWRADLCFALGGRDLTADERATMPVAADGPVCR